MENKIKVVSTRKLPLNTTNILKETYNFIENTSEEGLSLPELFSRCENAQGLIVTVLDKLTEDYINNLPDSIKIISTFSVGFDHINLEAARKRNIVITNTPDVLTDSTADITMLLLLGASRRCVEGISMARSGKWTGCKPTELMGVSLSGKRLGILGMGRIGRAVAKRARAFGMEIHYLNRNRLSGDLEEGAIYHSNYQDFLPVCEFLSLNCPSTPETVNFVREETISLLPDSAIIINTARGNVVNDTDLIKALKSGKLFAAGLDVYANEPNINKEYFGMDNVFMLPHLGSATVETREKMGNIIINNLSDFFSDKIPKNLV